MSALNSKTGWGIVLIIALVGAVGFGALTGKVALANCDPNTCEVGMGGTAPTPVAEQCSKSNWADGAEVCKRG